jgi:hypothetical protein
MTQEKTKPSTFLVTHQGFNHLITTSHGEKY